MVYKRGRVGTLGRSLTVINFVKYLPHPTPSRWQGHLSFLMDVVTSMRLVGSQMALTHSILINLFINFQLNNFLLPPLLSIVLVHKCSLIFRKVFDEGRPERHTFLPKK